MSAGSGFHAGNASVNLTRESSSSPNLTKNLVTTGMLIVFNNPVRVWKVIVFITPALHIGYINSRQTLPRTFSTVPCLRGLNFLDYTSEIPWRDFWSVFSAFPRSHFWHFTLKQITSKIYIAISFCLLHVLFRKKIIICRPLPQPKVVQLHTKHYFRFFPYDVKLSKTKLYS